MTATGSIKTVLLDQRFGFIEPADGGCDIFFHISDLNAELDWCEQLVARRVEFEQITTQRGQHAKNVRPAR